MGLPESLKRVEEARKSGLPGVVDALIEEAAILTASKLSYFALMSMDNKVLTMLGWSKKVMQNCAMIDKPIVYPIETTGLWGDCVRERKPVVTNDYKGLKKPTKKGYPSGHVDVVRHVNVCMMDGNRIVGVLGIGNKPSDYSDADVKVLQEFANAAYQLMPREEMEAIAG